MDVFSCLCKPNMDKSNFLKDKKIWSLLFSLWWCLRFWTEFTGGNVWCSWGCPLQTDTQYDQRHGCPPPRKALLSFLWNWNWNSEGEILRVHVRPPTFRVWSSGGMVKPNPHSGIDLGTEGSFKNHKTPKPQTSTQILQIRKLPLLSRHVGVEWWLTNEVMFYA